MSIALAAIALQAREEGFLWMWTVGRVSSLRLPRSKRSAAGKGGARGLSSGLTVASGLSQHVHDMSDVAVTSVRTLRPGEERDCKLHVDATLKQ